MERIKIDNVTYESMGSIVAELNEPWNTVRRYLEKSEIKHFNIDGEEYYEFMSDKQITSFSHIRYLINNEKDVHELLLNKVDKLEVQVDKLRKRIETIENDKTKE